MKKNLNTLTLVLCVLSAFLTGCGRDSGGSDGNAAPTANDLTQTTLVDTDVLIDLQGSDPDGDTLTYEIVSEPEKGSLLGVGSSSVTYKPGTGSDESDSFVYRVKDNGSKTSNFAKVTIALSDGGNESPMAFNSSVSADPGSPVLFTLDASDADVGDTLTYEIVTEPLYGTITLSGADVTYTAAADFSGTDELPFKVWDGTVYSNTAVATIVVEETADKSPRAYDGVVTTDLDTAVDVVLQADDPNNDTLTYIIVNEPKHGILSGTGETRTYSPASGYSGSDRLIFRAHDGKSSSNAAKVHINIQPAAPNHAPIVPDSVLAVTQQDTPAAIEIQASDQDGDTLTYTIVSQPAHGLLSGTAPDLTYTPASGFSGSDIFTWEAHDGTDSSSISKVLISVEDTGNHAPVAGDLHAVTDEETAVDIALQGADQDGDALTYSIISTVSNGTLSGTGADYTYTPEPGFSGNDGFSYRVYDGALYSNNATVNITVNTLTNHSPEAYDFGVTTAPDTPAAITLRGSDQDGDTLDYHFVTSPHHGIITGTAPDLTYTPLAGYEGSDRFLYRVSDGEVFSNTAAVAVFVTDGTNSPPCSMNFTVSTAKDTFADIELQAADADGDVLTYEIIQNPQNGSLTGSGSSRTYTPDTGYTGPDSIVYRVSDGTVYSNHAIVFFTVLPAEGATYPADISGYWELKIAGRDNLTNNCLWLEQTGTDITGALVWFGTVITGEYSDGILNFNVQETPEVTDIVTCVYNDTEQYFAGTFYQYFNGKLKDEADSFIMSSVDNVNGTLTLSGTADGTAIDTTSSIAIGSAVGVTSDYPYELGVLCFSGTTVTDLHISEFWNITGTGSYSATQLGACIMQADGPPTLIAEATGGTVDVTRWDSTGCAATFSLDFSDGGTVTGSFDVDYDILLDESASEGLCQSVNTNGEFSATFSYPDPANRFSSVEVSGPGIAGSLSLTLSAENEWEGEVVFGTAHDPAPFLYTFTITDSSTWTLDRKVMCFIDEYPTDILPSGSVSGPITFSWTRIPALGTGYDVILLDDGGSQVWGSDIDDFDFSSAPYTGPALSVGATYTIHVVNVGEGELGKSIGVQTFTYTGP